MATLSRRTVLRRHLAKAAAWTDPTVWDLLNDVAAGVALHEMVFDAEGKPVDYRFIRVNSGFEQLTGLAACGLAGKTVREVLPDTEPYWIETYAKVVLTGEPIRLKHYSRALDRHYEVHAYRSAPSQFVSSFTDITSYVKADGAMHSAQQELTASQMRFLDFYALAPFGCCTISQHGLIVQANLAAATRLGLSREALVGQPLSQFILDEDHDLHETHLKRLAETAAPQAYELRMMEACRAVFWGYLQVTIARDVAGAAFYHVVVNDISESRQMKAYAHMSREILQILNEPGDLQDSMERVLQVVQERTEFEAVGIRLQEGEDFPYFTQRGFSREFLLTETSLVERGANGGVCRDSDGNIRLECTCGLVISGKTDPTNPFFTEGGSCWTNPSPPSLNTLPSEDLRLHPRDECLHQGYASVALVPIRTTEGIVGLIQINDRRKGRLTLDMVERLEGVASHIGVALMRKRAEEGRRESEGRLSRIIEATQVGTWEWSVQSGVAVFNEQWAGIIGCTLDELAPTSIQTWLDCAHPDDLVRSNLLLQKHFAGEIPYYDTECRVRHRDGHWVWVQDRGCVTLWAGDGKPLVMAGTHTDISRRKAAEKQAALQERLVLALATSGDSIWDSDWLTGEICFTPRHYEMLEYPVGDLVIQCETLLEAVHPDDQSQLSALGEFLMGDDAHHYEYRRLASDGSWHWILARCKVVERSQTGAPTRVIGVDSDITDRKLREESLDFAGTHDSLTGLFNRFGMAGYLRSGSLKTSLPTALIMGDVNGLKLINDTFGHNEGDRLLVLISDLLKDAVGDLGTVARWGGDEFLAVLPGSDSAAATEVAHRAQVACTSYPHDPFPLSVALGVATRLTSEQSFDDVMRRAEERMYHSKLMDGKSARSSIIMALRETLSVKTFETDEHCLRMQNMAAAVVSTMGLSDSTRDDILLLALLHDIGKIGVAEAILAKPAGLTLEERAAVEKHAEIGFRIAKASYELSHIAEGILSHHEWWNGAGYPQGLTGKAIPLISRVIAVIDAYDAMTSVRPYRAALTRAEALEELFCCSGTQFDPEVVAAVIAIVAGRA